MRIRLSVPSKTFLLGEYVALNGGPSLLLNTKPRFELHISAPGSANCQGIHPSSPAGQWIRSRSEDFRVINAEFIDPHKGRGGLGASSAQYVLCFAWSYIQQKSFASLARGVPVHSLWEYFRALEHRGSAESAQPSGADVVAQATGGVTYFASEPFFSENLTWPFRDLEFVLLRTGHKMPTHEHLSSLARTETDDLKALVIRARDSFRSADSVALLDAVKLFALGLERRGLCAESSRCLLQGFRAHPDVLAAKGCGAMGADVLLLLHRPEKLQSVLQYCREQDLEVIAQSAQLSEFGLKMEVELDASEPRAMLNALNDKVGFA